MLGDLHVFEAKEILLRFVEENTDDNLVVAAQKALDKIAWINGESVNH